MIVFPDVINWNEKVSYGITNYNSEYDQQAGGQRLSNARPRRYLAFSISEEKIDIYGNIFEKNILEPVEVALPFYPMYCLVKDDTELQGNTQVVLNVNFWKRPLTCISDLQYGWPAPKFTGIDNFIVINTINKNYEIKQIIEAERNDNGGVIGEDFNQTKITLNTAIGIQIKAKELMICNYMKAMITAPQEIERFTINTGNFNVALVEIYEDEME